MSDADKAYYLGQAYGLRAFHYFDLYRTYGTAPLQLDPNKVVNGNFNPEELYEGRASGSAMMAQIKSDLEESLKYFGDNNSFDPSNRSNKKAYWSKAATECLMGEVYLWNAKVSTDDNQANEADLAIAKKSFIECCQQLRFVVARGFYQCIFPPQIKVIPKSLWLYDTLKVKRLTAIPVSCTITKPDNSKQSVIIAKMVF